MATAFDEMMLANPRWELAERRANELSEPFTAPPIPVLEIAESHGVDVVFADFDNAGEKVAGFCDFQNGRIYVNDADRLARQTFTIAHELGHWILHRSYFESAPQLYQILPRFQRVARHNPFEQEANCFAANLLVPARLLKPVRNAPVAQLADIFAVSREMMENRLKSVR